LRVQIQKVESQSELRLELSSQFSSQYRNTFFADEGRTADLIQRIYRHAVWCSGAKDWRTREAVFIGFFEDLGLIAANGAEPVREQIIRDAVANLGFSGHQCSCWFDWALEQKRSNAKILTNCSEDSRRQLEAAC
jgi:hypothetical protein